MNRWTVLLAALLIVAMGCSGGSDPIAPSSGLDLSGPSVQAAKPQTHLWGYYDVYIDIENQTVEAVVNRSVQFAANVVDFVNGNPANLQFVINDTPVEPEYIGVDIDVRITHPFPGMSMYNGYDVFGVFMGDGAETLAYSLDCDAAEYGTDQYMFGADGYTRWFNRSEFTTPGLLGYTPGAFASPGFAGTATVNPYKYFADGLSATGNVGDFLATTTKNGVFSAGATNSRNYLLRFPNTKGVVYGYAIVANWIDEETHPANAVEGVAATFVDNSDVYWVDGTSNGGHIRTDFTLYGWGDQPSAIYFESNVLTGGEVPVPLTPTAGGDNWSTYHFEVTVDDVNGPEGASYWFICEYDGYDYTNDLGVSNSANTDTLASFFRYDIAVLDYVPHIQPDCVINVVTPMPHNGDCCIEFDAGDCVAYEGAVITDYLWDFNDDGTFGDAYDSGTDVNPEFCYGEDYVGDVGLRIIDDQDGQSTCWVSIDCTYNPFYKEDHTTNPTDWSYWMTFYFGGSGDPAPAHTTTAPFGPSGSGNVRCPLGGNYLSGGCQAQVITPPFAVPSGYSSIIFRAYGSMAAGGSWSGYWGANVKGTINSTPGISGFQPNGALGSATLLQPNLTHGAAWGPYDQTLSYSSGGLDGQQVWGAQKGGGAFPGTLTQYWDVTIPASWYGQTIKICFSYQTDWPGFVGSGAGFALDDFELIGF